MKPIQYASFQIVHFCAPSILENRGLQGQRRQAEWESSQGPSSSGQAEQMLCPQPLLHNHHSSFSTGIAPQHPYLPEPGGPSQHTMPRNSLPFPTVPPAPLPAQLSCGGCPCTLPTLPTLSSRDIPKATTGSQHPDSCRELTARLVLSVPSSPCPSRLV